MNNKTKNYLGIDWGEVRIGLALGDSEVKIATPFKTVKNIKEIMQVIGEEEINEIVLGKPLKLLGEKIKLQPEYLDFVQALKNKTNLPIKLVDERMSSKAGDALVGDKKTKASRDEIAAMLILQGYLDSENKAS